MSAAIGAFHVLHSLVRMEQFDINLVSICTLSCTYTLDHILIATLDVMVPPTGEWGKQYSVSGANL